MTLTTITITNTFEDWRTRTNELVTQSNLYESDILYLYNKSNNSPSYAFANNIGVTANAFASATIAGANAFVLATIAGANSAVGLGANSYANVVWSRANNRMDLGGQQANAFASATIAGANTAVGAGANAYALAIITASSSESGAGFLATINGANTAVGAGANSYANVVWSRANTRMDLGGAGANAFASATIAGANTAVGAGANAHMRATLAGANAAVGLGANTYAGSAIATVIATNNPTVGAGANSYATAAAAGANAHMRATLTGANNFTIATLNGANTDARNATNLTGGIVPSSRLSGAYLSVTGVGTLSQGTWNASIIPVGYGGTGQSTIGGIQTALGLAGMAYQASSSVSISGGSISGLTSLAVSGPITATGDITAFSSDARLKGNIETITDALSKVKLITGITYKHNDLAKSFGYTDENRYAGVLAQEVEVVLPEVVVPAPFDVADDGTSKSGKNYKTVKYEKLVPLLIEAIKELTAKVEMLESKIEK